MKNKIAFVMMIFLLVCPVFAAKPKKEGKISKIRPKNTVNLKVFIPKQLDYSAALDLQSQELLSKLNIKLEITYADANLNETLQPYDLIVCDINAPEYKTKCLAGDFLDWEENNLLKKWGANLQNEKKVGIQKNKFFDSPDRRLHGYGLTLTQKPVIEYEYKNILQLCNDVIASHYGYVEFGMGYYNPVDGTFYEKLADDGPYFYTLKFLNALHQNEYKFEDAKPGNFENLIKHYEENINFQEVTEEETVEEKALNPVYYGSNFVWTISSLTEYPELCMATINQLSLNELESFSKYPVSLFTTSEYTEEVSKVIDKVTLSLEEKSIAAVNAASNEEYEAAITDLKNILAEAGYDVCKDFYSAQAQNRFFAEKMAKRTKK